jgi:hypothetical protein
MACFCYKCPEHSVKIKKDRGCMSASTARMDRVLDAASREWRPEIIHFGTELVATTFLLLLSSFALSVA